MLMDWGGVKCRPGFHLIEGGGGADPDESLNVNAAVSAALGADPLAGFSAALTLVALVVEDIQPGTRPTVTYPYALAQGDHADDNPLPPQSAGVISVNTAVKPITGAFAAQGRIYMPGTPADGQISGFLQSAFQGVLSAFASKIFDVFVTDGTAYQWNIVSYTPGSKPRTVRAFNPVTSFSINNVVRSQRRREVGVGE
jgi:hypothetical protein